MLEQECTDLIGDSSSYAAPVARSRSGIGLIRTKGPGLILDITYNYQDDDSLVFILGYQFAQ